MLNFLFGNATKSFGDLFLGYLDPRISDSLSCLVLNMVASMEKFVEVHKEFMGEEQLNITDKEHDKSSEEVENLDVSNSKAFKGDDSDGKVRWTPKSVIAVLSLSMLNAGMRCIQAYLISSAAHSAIRLTDNTLLRWWQSFIHR